MSEYRGLEMPIQPDWPGLIDNILRKGTPRRVHHIELFHDQEIASAIVDRFDLAAGLDPGDEHYPHRCLIALQRFLGFDYVRTSLVDLPMPLHKRTAEDTAGLQRDGGRIYQDEHTGPIRDWESFEKYPWPDPREPSATRDLEWYQEHLPQDMCIIASGTGHLCEFLCWLFGYESLCYALHDQRALVRAVAEKLTEFYRVTTQRFLEFDRVRMIWPSDDMGFKTQLLFSAADMRELVLPGHKIIADLAHQAGRACILHSCGKLDEIIDDLIDDVGIDAKHSFEDTIEDVREIKHTYGQRIALLGGIDVDFLCRADPAAIRQRVRETLDICMPGGGYCLGSGNSVANYIPVENYLAMVDEGRLYAAG